MNTEAVTNAIGGIVTVVKGLIVVFVFANIIYQAGYASPIRKTRGDDIMAACGQLKSATERARKSRKQIEAEAGMGQS